MKMFICVMVIMVTFIAIAIAHFWAKILFPKQIVHAAKETQRHTHILFHINFVS